MSERQPAPNLISKHMYCQCKIFIFIVQIAFIYMSDEWMKYDSHLNLPVAAYSENYRM